MELFLRLQQQCIGVTSGISNDLDAFSQGDAVKLAIAVIDMLVDNLKTGKHAAVEREGMAIVPALVALLRKCRAAGIPVIFANDSFLPGDAIFESCLQPHSLRGTPGASVIPELTPSPGTTSCPSGVFQLSIKPIWTRLSIR